MGTTRTYLTPEEVAYQMKNINDNRGPEILVSTIILAVLATLAVILRLACRRFTKLAISWDDYLIIVGLVFTLAMCFCQAYSIDSGYGKHVLAAGVLNVQRYIKLFWAIAMAFIKVSILLFYQRLFPPGVTSRTWRICHLTLLIASVAFCLISLFGSGFACTPVTYLWDITIQGGHCINLIALARFTCTTGFITDILILTLPMPILWTLQMDRSKKIGVCGVFLLGGFVCVASVVRFYYLEQISRNDPTWANVNSGIWTTVESSIGIISACLPIMGPFLRTKIVAAVTTIFRSKESPQASSALTSPSGANKHKEKKGFARLVGAAPRGVGGIRQGSDGDEEMGMASRGQGLGKEEGAYIGVHEVRL